MDCIYANEIDTRALLARANGRLASSIATCPFRLCWGLLVCPYLCHVGSCSLRLHSGSLHSYPFGNCGELFDGAACDHISLRWLPSNTPSVSIFALLDSFVWDQLPFQDRSPIPTRPSNSPD